MNCNQECTEVEDEGEVKHELVELVLMSLVLPEIPWKEMVGGVPPLQTFSFLALLGSQLQKED